MKATTKKLPRARKPRKKPRETLAAKARSPISRNLKLLLLRNEK